jgi:hypothetical protein
VTWSEFSTTKSHELKPGGRDVEVTAENREEYVELYVQWLLVDSIAKQFNDFMVRAGEARDEEGMGLGLGLYSIVEHFNDFIVGAGNGGGAKARVLLFAWTIVGASVSRGPASAGVAIS